MFGKQGFPFIQFFCLLCCGMSLGLSAQIAPMQFSHTPPLVIFDSAAFPSARAYGLISSADTLSQSPTFRFAGTADGAGFMRNGDGSFLMTVNHEDNRSVSRIILDSTLRPVAGDYLFNSNAGYWRLCSATMATPEEHGFGPYFITCSEDNFAFIHYVNPYGPPIHDSATSFNTTLAVGMGQWRAENAVPLPVATYNKTVVCIGDDDAGFYGGQFVMYIGNSVGDLLNGTIYVLRRTDLNQREKDIIPGQIYPVELAPFPAGSFTWNMNQLNAYSDTTLKSIKFNRIEDLDYRKGNASAAREIYFNASGITNPDTSDRTWWGRVYRLKLDSIDPTKGTLECILDGDDKSPSNQARFLYNPDNICATEDYVYVQEDPTGINSPLVHDACIYQYDIQDDTLRTMLMLDHHRHSPDSATYNRDFTGLNFQVSGTGGWESGAMLDISKQTGVPKLFTLCLQTHSWRDPLFRGVDGGTRAINENQGSVVLLLSGIDRIKVHPPITSGDTICAESSATLFATAGTTFFATNGTNYNWYTSAVGGSPFFTGAVYQTPVLFSDTSFFVETIADGTPSTTRSLVTVVVKPRPAQPAIDSFGIFLFSSASQNNQWLLNGFTLPSDTSQQLTVIQAGSYSVFVTENGCVSPQSNPVYFAPGALPNGPQEIIFPNPGNGNITILADSLYELVITDATGRLVRRERFSSVSIPTTINVQSLAEGVYTFELYSARGTSRMSFVRQRND
jgi:Ig-like domain CHU_C associated/Secretion system C-terminal sorting domain